MSEETQQTLTLDKALDFSYQIVQALKTVSDPIYRDAFGRIHELLQLSVECRDQIASLTKSRENTRQLSDLLVQQNAALKEDIAKLEEQKASLERAVDGKREALDKLRADAKRAAEKIAND